MTPDRWLSLLRRRRRPGSGSVWLVDEEATEARLSFVEWLSTTGAWKSEASLTGRAPAESGDASAGRLSGPKVWWPPRNLAMSCAIVLCRRACRSDPSAARARATAASALTSRERGDSCRPAAAACKSGLPGMGQRPSVQLRRVQARHPSAVGRHESPRRLSMSRRACSF
jgi:hypothetical protein